MNFVEDILLDPAFIRGEDFNRLDILRMIMAGYNNSFIANQLNFSVKNIENIISKFLKRADIDTKSPHNHLVTPRVKLLVHGLTNKWLGFRMHADRSAPKSVTRQQFSTIMMCAIGCSNQAMADILFISPKAIESRLNNLFNQFGLKSKGNNNVNPRMSLITSSILNNVIKTQDIIHLASEVNFENWTETTNKREQIDRFLDQYQYQKYQYLHQGDNVQNIYSYIQPEANPLNQTQTAYGNYQQLQYMNSLQQ